MFDGIIVATLTLLLLPALCVTWYRIPEHDRTGDRKADAARRERLARPAGARYDKVGGSVEESAKSQGPIAAVEVFWGPMAYATIGGIIVATLLTLLFLSVLYVAWYRIREHEPTGDRKADAALA